MSQKEFASKLGIQPPYLSELENNKKDVTTKILMTLKEEVDVSIDLMLTLSSRDFLIDHVKSQYHRDKKARLYEEDLKGLINNFGHIPINEVLEYMKLSEDGIRN